MNTKEIRHTSKKRKIIIRAVVACIVCVVTVGTIGCIPKTSHTQGVFMLLDTRGTTAAELKKAGAIINYLIGTLGSDDSLAVGRIDTGNFNKNDIIAKVTFDRRPLVANNQKRAFKKKIDTFISQVKGNNDKDISGGILQAVEYLNKLESGKKYILIFSDLDESLVTGHVKDIPFRLSGVEVFAFNITKLTENINFPDLYPERAQRWRTKVEQSAGVFRVIDDLEHLDLIFITDRK